MLPRRVMPDPTYQRRIAHHRLEVDLQRELHDPRIAGAVDRPKFALLSAVIGALKFTWLITLKISQRNCSVWLEPTLERAGHGQIVLQSRRVHDRERLQRAVGAGGRDA